MSGVLRTKAAGSDEGKAWVLTNGPKTINHPANDDCTDKRPNKYFEPSAAFNQVAKKVAGNAAEHSADYSRDL